MGTLTAQTPTSAGLIITTQAADSEGDSFTNTGNEILEAWNDHAADPRTVTIAVTITFDGSLTADNREVTITAAEDRAHVGPFNTQYYGSTVNVTYSDSAADMRVALIKYGGVQQ